MSDAPAFGLAVRLDVPDELAAGIPKLAAALDRLAAAAERLILLLDRAAPEGGTPPATPPPAQAADAAGDAAPPPAEPVDDTLWTAARVALLQTHYKTSRRRSAILADLNALPGPPVSATAMHSYAGYHKLFAPGAMPPPDPGAIAPGGEEVPDDVVLAWAAQWYRPALAHTDPVRRLARVNNKRRELGLPLWRLAPARTPERGLPGRPAKAI